jgi:hypothetical protein
LLEGISIGASSTIHEISLSGGCERPPSTALSVA